MKMPNERGKSGEDLILTCIVLAGGPLRMVDIAKVTGLSKQHISYWLPKMIASGILLSSDQDGITLYEPQPIVTCKELQGHLEDLYATILEDHEDFFVIDQADCPAEEVLKNNILKSLKMFGIKVRDLEAE